MQRSVIFLKRIFVFLLTLVLLLSLIACSEDVTEGSTDESVNGSSVGSSVDESVDESVNSDTETSEDENMSFDKTKTYNILFIGNSYTYYNDMPTKIFEQIANSVGVKVKVDSITKGGWWLWDHANSDDEMGKIVDGAFKKTKYDYVILQDQSTLPIDDPGCFYDGVRNICEKVRANGATPILYCTWGRKTGSETLANRGLTHESMTWKLAAGYTAIAKELNIDVAYVGLSFTDVYTNYPTLTNLYADDLTHPSYSGSYLATLTIFTEITNIDPEEITYNGSLTGNIVSVLKQAAKKAVFETVDIPDEYKVNSEGIHYVK